MRLEPASQRRDAPFVPVNCGAITLSLIESELFGHERGAFTGAHARKLGKVELAAGGTLFLDEIGEMGPDAQVRLLRLLEERTFERVGGTTSLTADVRVVSATNRDLQELVDEGTFRRDLYFRLNVFPIHMPPLRTRRQDIDLLATHFLAAAAGPRQQAPLSLSPGAAAALRDHRWPGNIREPRNTIERATLVCQGRPIQPEDLALPPAETEAESTLRGRMAALGIKRPKGLQVTSWAFDTRPMPTLQRPGHQRLRPIVKWSVDSRFTAAISGRLEARRDVR